MLERRRPGRPRLRVLPGPGQRSRDQGDEDVEGQRRRAAAQRGLLARRLRRPQARLHRRATTGPRSQATSTASTRTASSSSCGSRAPGPATTSTARRRATRRCPMADADHSLDFWTLGRGRFRRQPRASSSTPTTSRTRSPGTARSTAARSTPTAPRASRSSAPTRRSATRRSSTRSARPAPRSRSSSPASTSPATSSQWEQFMPNDPPAPARRRLEQLRLLGQPAPARRATCERSRRRHPVVVGGFGDTDCNSDYSTKLMQFADGHGISLSGLDLEHRGRLRRLLERAARPDERRPTTPAIRAASARASASTSSRWRRAKTRPSAVLSAACLSAGGNYGYLVAGVGAVSLSRESRSGLSGRDIVSDRLEQLLEPREVSARAGLPHP